MMAVAVPFHGRSALVLLPFFAATYLLALLMTLVGTGESVGAYGVAFGLGAMVLCAPFVWAFITATALTYAAGYAGLQRSFRRFPRDFEPILSPGKRGEGRDRPRQGQASKVGWPFEQLSPPREIPRLSLGQGILISLLAGWLFFAVGWRIESSVKVPTPPEERSLGAVYFFICIATLLAIWGRMGAYHCSTRVPPISLAGRYATRRWIIPGYDKVLVAPLLTILSALALPSLLTGLGTGPAVAGAVALTCAMLSLLTVGPSLSGWLLTGEHRILGGDFGEQPKDTV
jgi:hypothetical protein